MKKPFRFMLALAVTLLLALSATALGEATPFALQDLVVNTTPAGATPDEVRKAIGEPSAMDTATVAATGTTVDTWQYGGLTLTFTEGKLIGAEWNDPALSGPHGIKIGDSQATVKAAFFADTAQTSPDVLYTAGWVEALQAQLPPCGTVTRNADGTVDYIYIAPTQAYPSTVQADPASYVYENHAVLTFGFAADTQQLQRIRWTVGAMAE